MADEKDNTPIDALLTPEAPRRRRWIPWAVGAGLVVVLGGGYVGAQAALANRVPAGVSVAGVDVGGMSQEEATAAVEQFAAARGDQPLTVTAGGNSATIVPAEAGLTVDVAATVKGLTGFTLNPARLAAALGGHRTVEVVVNVDDDALHAAVEQAAEDLNVAPQDGSVTVVSAEPVATDPVDGLHVDIAATAERIKQQWLESTEPVAAVVSPEEPTIGADEVSAALEVAKTIMSGPVWVESEAGKAELPVDAFASGLTFVADGSDLVATLDAGTVGAAVLARLPQIQTDPVNASFTFTDDKPAIVPGAPGAQLDADATTAAVLEAAQGADRVAQAAVTEVQPEVTDASLEELGIKEVVASFETPLTNDAVRTENLRVGAARLTGTLVKPGETFSVTDAIGPITAENGYGMAGVVVNGIHTNGMGGGLSQMATTTYNVGFFAGMTDIEHRPHTEYYSRYPEGREATIYTGQIDMRWRNDSPYGVLMRGWVGDGVLHVEAWSTKYFDVQTTTSPRSNVVQPTVKYITDPACEPSPAGNPGFTVTVTRKVTVISTGEVPIDESLTVRYIPTDRVVCGPDPATQSAEDGAAG